MKNPSIVSHPHSTLPPQLCLLNMRRLQCRYRPAACISQPFGSSSLRSITTLPTRGAFPLAEYENASSAATKALLSQSTAVLTTAVPQQLLDRLQELHSDVQDVISPEDPPSKFGRYLMWSERREDATMYKRVDSSKKEQVVLDMARFNKEMKFKHSFLGSMALSNDSYQRFVAFTVDSEGRDSFTCFVRDIFRGVTLRDRINRVGTMAWAPDQKGEQMHRKGRERKGKSSEPQESLAGLALVQECLINSFSHFRLCAPAHILCCPTFRRCPLSHLLHSAGLHTPLQQALPAHPGLSSVPRLPAAACGGPRSQHLCLQQQGQVCSGCAGAGGAFL